MCIVFFILITIISSVNIHAAYTTSQEPAIWCEELPSDQMPSHDIVREMINLEDVRSRIGERLGGDVNISAMFFYLQDQDNSWKCVPVRDPETGKILLTASREQDPDAVIGFNRESPDYELFCFFNNTIPIKHNLGRLAEPMKTFQAILGGALESSLPLSSEEMRVFSSFLERMQTRQVQLIESLNGYAARDADSKEEFIKYHYDLFMGLTDESSNPSNQEEAFRFLEMVKDLPDRKFLESMVREFARVEQLFQDQVKKDIQNRNFTKFFKELQNMHDAYILRDCPQSLITHGRRVLYNLRRQCGNYKRLGEHLAHSERYLMWKLYKGPIWEGVMRELCTTQKPKQIIVQLFTTRDMCFDCTNFLGFEYISRKGMFSNLRTIFSDTVPISCLVTSTTKYQKRPEVNCFDPTSSSHIKCFEAGPSMKPVPNPLAFFEYGYLMMLRMEPHCLDTIRAFNKVKEPLVKKNRSAEAETDPMGN